MISLNLQYQSYLTQLKSLISATKNDYEKLYLAAIEPAYNIIAQALESNQDEKLTALFKQLIAALKIRRAYMLPIGSDIETCYQQQDAWTYGLFTAVLIKNISDLGNSDINPQQFAQKIIPETGLTWLKKYSSLFQHWEGYISRNQDDKNPFAIITNQANAALGFSQSLP